MISSYHLCVSFQRLCIFAFRHGQPLVHTCWRQTEVLRGEEGGDAVLLCWGKAWKPTFGPLKGLEEEWWWRRSAAATHGPNFTVVDGGVPADAGAGTGLQSADINTSVIVTFTSTTRKLCLWTYYAHMCMNVCVCVQSVALCSTNSSASPPSRLHCTHSVCFSVTFTHTHAETEQTITEQSKACSRAEQDTECLTSCASCSSWALNETCYSKPPPPPLLHPSVHKPSSPSFFFSPSASLYLYNLPVIFQVQKNGSSTVNTYINLGPQWIRWNPRDWWFNSWFLNVFRCPWTRPRNPVVTSWTWSLFKMFMININFLFSVSDWVEKVFTRQTGLCLWLDF